MYERALKNFLEAFDKIREGNLFDEHNNHAFEYMLKNLWGSPYQKQVKSTLLHNLPVLFDKTKSLENPPPFFYILISLKDSDINKSLITEAIMDFIKSNASETATYQLLNFLQTMDDKGVKLDSFIVAIINSIKPSMDNSMVEALAHMLTITHPEYLRKFLDKFLSFTDKSLLKNFVNMGGRRALLELLQIMTPGEVKKLLGK
jgi:hypothetical protein